MPQLSRPPFPFQVPSGWPAKFCCHRSRTFPIEAQSWSQPALGKVRETPGRFWAKCGIYFARYQLGYVSFSCQICHIKPGRSAKGLSSSRPGDRQIALGESVKKKTSTQARWQARIDLVSSGDQLQLDKLHYIYIYIIYIYIYINMIIYTYSNSLTWIVMPFGDDARS